MLKIYLVGIVLVEENVCLRFELKDAIEMYFSSY